MRFYRKWKRKRFDKKLYKIITPEQLKELDETIIKTYYDPVELKKLLEGYKNE